LVFFFEKVSLAVAHSAPRIIELPAPPPVPALWREEDRAVFGAGAALEGARNLVGVGHLRHPSRLTKEVTSICLKLHSESLSTSRILSAVAIGPFSNCMPSRGPTSLMLTNFGSAIGASRANRQGFTGFLVHILPCNMHQPYAVGNIVSRRGGHDEAHDYAHHRLQIPRYLDSMRRSVAFLGLTANAGCQMLTAKMRGDSVSAMRA